MDKLVNLIGEGAQYREVSLTANMNIEKMQTRKIQWVSANQSLSEDG
jgi:hypothetical protein